MSAPHFGAFAATIPPLPELGPRAGEATVAVHDEGDHLAAYLAPAPLGQLLAALATDEPNTVWNALGEPLSPGQPIPDAGEAVAGVPVAQLPTSLRAHPRAALAASHDWVLCVEDGIHATLFARRASIVVRAVHATVAHLLSGVSDSPARLDPRLIGTLARPTFRGPHKLRLDRRDGCLWARSPNRTVALAPTARGIWRILP
jgi:hypothetical protein